MKENSIKAKDDEGKQNLKRVFQNNIFIVKYIYKYTPLFLIGSFLVATISEVVVFFEHPYCIKYITDIIQYNGSFSNVVKYIAVISVVVALKILMTTYYNNYVQPKAKEKLHKYIRMDLFNKAVSLDLSCYDNPEYYNDFVWSISEATNRIDQTIEYLYQIVRCITVIFTTGALFVILNKAGLLFILFSVITSIFINLISNKLRYKMDAELIPKQRYRSYLNRVFYLADYAKEIRLNDIADKLKKNYNKSNEDIYNIIDKRSPKLVQLGLLSNYVFNSFILDSLYTVYLLFLTVVKKTISYGSVIALLNSSWSLKSNLLRLSDLVPQFQQNSLYIERIRTFLDYKQQIKDSNDAKEVPEEPSILELKNVSFTYSEKDKNIIKNISLKIKPYEKIALVGYNGAGKTTLTKLLMRLYDVSEGEILLNNVNIKDYKIESYRNNIRSVFQDYQIFASSIAENVIMDEIKEHHTKGILDALDKSGFTEKLNQLKYGVNTQLTREFEDSGVNISGGEAQKIAISRVFANPCQIIILDEPSSALDPISEYNLNKAMLEAAKNKTVIFISHRLSSTRMADRIYMFEDGNIIEEGSHDELMAHGGKYAQMFNLQAEKYRFKVS